MSYLELSLFLFVFYLYPPIDHMHDFISSYKFPLSEYLDC